MNISKMIMAVTLALILSITTTAQASDTKDVMDSIKGKLSEIKSYTVDVKMETSMMGQTMVSEGNMTFKKPGKTRLITTTTMMGGMEQQVYSSNDIGWTYMPQMKMATKVDMSKIRSVMPDQIGMAQTADITDPFSGFAKVEYKGKKPDLEKEYHVFEGIPALPPGFENNQLMSQMFPKKVIFWLNIDSGLPYRLETIAGEGAPMMTITYTNYKTNIDIDDSEFEFAPPGDVQVMDMTEATLNMMRPAQAGGQPPSGQMSPGGPGAGSGSK